ncbi:hypothetical protein Tco_0927939 [Tanacetum coccineum]
MGSDSTSNSAFPGFSSQTPMTPEQFAFLQTQQEAFIAFQQTYQNISTNPPQQQSQSSNSFPQQTDSQPKKSRVKHVAKRSKGKEAEPTGEVTLRWSSDEEALLAECFVAVSEDRYVDKQMDDFEPSLPKVQRKYKRRHRLKKSDESEVDLMGRARGMYQDESKNSSFNHEKAWAILRQHAKWDAPEVAPVDLTEDEPDDFHATVNTDELFGADPRPRPPGKQRTGKKPKSDTSASTGGSQSSQFGDFVSHELRLKREAAEKAFEASKDKDETIKSLEELRFLALSTKDLSDDDAYWIERKKAQIKVKLRAEMPMEPNNEDDSDELFNKIRMFNF